MFRDNPRVAVSETRGLVTVSGAPEKRRVEEGNSAGYRSIVGLFDKVETAVQRDQAAKRSRAGPVRSETNGTSGATGSAR